MSEVIPFLLSLVEWQNVLFTTAAGLGLTFFAAQTFGLAVNHDHDADVDHDLDAGHDVDHDAGVDHDADADHDADHAGAPKGIGPGASSLSPGVAGGGFHPLAWGLRTLGFGRVPLSLLIPLALVSFGFSGLFASLALGGIGEGAKDFAEILFAPSLLLACTGSALTLHGAGRFFRHLAPDGKTASDRYDLLGLIGTVKSGKVDLEFGQVRVKDAFGNELEVPCVALDPARLPQYGDEVVLVDWDPASNRFKIVPFNESGDDRARRLGEARARAQQLRRSDRKARGLKSAS